MTEVRMKIYLECTFWHDWLGLSLEVVKDQFFSFFYLDLIYFIYCTAVSFYYKLAEVPGVARGILKIELRQKTLNFFSFCHPQGYP